MSGWTGDPEMLAWAEQHGILAEADRVLDAIDRGDTEALGPVLTADEVLARLDAIIDAKRGVRDERGGPDVTARHLADSQSSPP